MKGYSGTFHSVFAPIDLQALAFVTLFLFSYQVITASLWLFLGSILTVAILDSTLKTSSTKTSILLVRLLSLLTPASRAMSVATVRMKVL